MVKHIQNPASIIRILGTALSRDWIKYVLSAFQKGKSVFLIGFAFHI